MNKIIQAALAALSRYDVDLKNRYEIERRIERTTRPYYNKFGCNVMERIIHLPRRDILTRTFSRDGKIAPLMIFFHGGGFVTGDFDSYNNVCANIAIKTGYKVISVNYRLAPEYKFPAGVEDAYAVTQEIFSHCRDWYQTDADSIVLIGDSAGATLSAVVSLMARDRGGYMPGKQILIYPAAHGDYRGYIGKTSWENSPATPFESVYTNGNDFLLTLKKLNDYMELYISQEEDYTHPYFAPLNHTDFRDMPRTLLITMEYDPLRDEGEELGRRIRKAGGSITHARIKNGIHGMFTLPPGTPLTRQIYKHILDFITSDEVV